MVSRARRVYMLGISAYLLTEVSPASRIIKSTTNDVPKPLVFLDIVGHQDDLRVCDTRRLMGEYGADMEIVALVTVCHDVYRRRWPARALIERGCHRRRVSERPLSEFTEWCGITCEHTISWLYIALLSSQPLHIHPDDAGGMWSKRHTSACYA